MAMTIETTDWSSEKAVMASSRIFVKGLPPTISEDDFRKHFGATQAITDAKVIPSRRIGYVGYKNPEDAARAVKYFNKTYIRMSRIGVELARPVSDARLPPSRKQQREQAREAEKATRNESAKLIRAGDEAGRKRKRSDFDETDPKLREFLEIMQPSRKLNMWDGGAAGNSLEEPPTKVQAIESPGAESDGEYEVIPKITLRKEKAEDTAVPSNSTYEDVNTMTASHPQNLDDLQTEAADDGHTEAPNAVAATDDDWLRSRTSRLLDLQDPNDFPKPSPPPQQTSIAPNIQLPTSHNDHDHKPADNRSTDSVMVAKGFTAAEGSGNTNDEIATDPTIDAIRSNGRLFVRNLPYDATEDDLRTHFAVYGSLDEVHIPVTSSGAAKGFALVQFSQPDAAVEAWHNVDGEPFQGRLIHVLPAASKRETKLDEHALSQLPLKKQKQIKKKSEASSSTFNWNSLYMNQDAVNSSVADRLGVSKSEMLDPTSADAGVKQAIAETSTIQEAKAYFARNGVDLNAFTRRERGDKAILVKNFPYGMTLEELRKLFEQYGQVLQVLMPPTGTIAIVEFAQPTHARAAFASLAYRRVRDAVLFLEKAPKDLFTTKLENRVTDGTPQQFKLAEEAAVGAKISASELLSRNGVGEDGDTSTLFVRNLNFSTTSARLTEGFKPLGGFMSARVNTKIHPKKPGQVLSMGFGFVEFRSNSDAQAALKVMDGYTLDSHKLAVKASHKGLDAAEQRRKEDKAKKLAGRRTKIVIKNLPFEASRKDVRKLFGTYGQLRSVRVPKKFDSSTRGFAFADFISAQEAENALEALKDTHLLGRRLVLEFASADVVDAEEEIQKLQAKVGRQVDKVALQKLTGGGRKKFDIEGNNDDGE